MPKVVQDEELPEIEQKIEKGTAQDENLSSSEDGTQISIIQPLNTESSNVKTQIVSSTSLSSMVHSSDVLKSFGWDADPSCFFLSKGNLPKDAYRAWKRALERSDPHYRDIERLRDNRERCLSSLILE